MSEEEVHRRLTDVLERYLSHMNHLSRPVAAEIAAHLVPIVKEATAGELDTWVEHFDVNYIEVILGGADYVCATLAQRSAELVPNAKGEQ